MTDALRQELLALPGVADVNAKRAMLVVVLTDSADTEVLVRHLETRLRERAPWISIYRLERRPPAVGGAGAGAS